MMFYDRHDAGITLAKKLEHYKNNKNTIVLGLARGGVVVAYDIAKWLSLPLNVVVPKKLGAPGNPELAIGAILENGEGIFNDNIIQMFRIPKRYIDQEIADKKSQAKVRSALYRQFAPLPSLKNRTVILVDDGIATGATMLASIKAMRVEGVSKIVVAVPVASTEALRAVDQVADEVVCLYNSEDFFAVGYYYTNFGQTEDEEVIALLKELNHLKAQA